MKFSKARGIYGSPSDLARDDCHKSSALGSQHISIISLVPISLFLPSFSILSFPFFPPVSYRFSPLHALLQSGVRVSDDSSLQPECIIAPRPHSFLTAPTLLEAQSETSCTHSCRKTKPATAPLFSPFTSTLEERCINTL